MSVSRRQQPPTSRSGLYAALVVAGIILVGVVGWLANSIVNQRTGQEKQQLAERISSDRDSDPGEESRNAAKATTRERQAVVRPDAKGDLPITRKKMGRKESTEVSGDISEPSGLLENEKQSNSKRTIPKLSDLTTYKKNPNRDPIKLPSSRDSERREKTVKQSQGKSVSRERESETDSKGLNSTETNQFAFPQQSTPIDFYQELIVDRNPVFGIEGIKSVEQKFKYRAISKISVGPADSNGFRKVIQKVVSANLISADTLSKKSLTESVRNLIGKEFQFTLDPRQKLVDFKGEKEKPKTLDLKDLKSLDVLLGEGKKGEGMMMTSVMDLDGWKEMAQLTFLLPDDKKKKWTDQMEHDWGEIGRWVGETHFEKKTKTKGRLRIDYSHWMRYEPAAKGGKSSLPFTLGDVSFKSDEAGGRMQFNTEKNRIDSLIERFRVEGEVSASLLGGSTKMKIKEVQTFELYLHDQQPQ